MKTPERVTLAGTCRPAEPLEERHRDDLLAAAARTRRTFRYLFTDLSQGASVWPDYLADALKPSTSAGRRSTRELAAPIGSTRFLDIAPEHGRR